MPQRAVYGVRCISGSVRGSVLLSIFVTTLYFMEHNQHRFGNYMHKTTNCCTTILPSAQKVFTTRIQAGFRAQHNNQTLQMEEKSMTKPRMLHDPNDWPEFFTPRRHQQFSMKYAYVHSASRACQPSVDMLVMTLSRPQNHLQRQAIRETWGSVVTSGTWPETTKGAQMLEKRLGLIFLLGEDQRSERQALEEAVRKESEKHGDIVQWKGLHDTYFNLTMKVLLGLQWVREFCPNMSHVIKTDDDTFVHVPRLLQRLSGKRQQQEPTNKIWGYYSVSSYCERMGKYTVSREAYPFDKYPPHVKGNLYVLSGDAVSRLARMAAYFPYNNMEDVHVTGTLARAGGMSHEAFRRQEFSPYPFAPDVCFFVQNKVLGAQSVSPDLAARIWGTLVDNRSCQ